MRAVVGAVLAHAGCMLIAAGILANDLGSSTYSHSNAGYIIGGALLALGLIVIIAGPLKRGWDAIPVEESSKSNISPTRNQDSSSPEGTS